MIVRKCIRSALVSAQKTAKNAWKRHAQMPNWLDLSSVDNQGKFVIFWRVIGYEPDNHLIFFVESVVLVAHDLLGDLPGGGQLLRIVFHRFQHPTGLPLHFLCLFFFSKKRTFRKFVQYSWACSPLSTSIGMWAHFLAMHFLFGTFFWFGHNCQTFLSPNESPTKKLRYFYYDIWNCLLLLG